MQNWIQSSCLLGSRFACAQAVIFFAKPYPKNAGEASIGLWVAAWEWRTSSFRNPNQKRAGLWWIFSSSNSAPANRKTGFYANREPNKQEDWRPFCMERLRTLNSCKIFKIKNKKLKTYSGWCPFKVLSNDTTLMQIQSGRTVPFITFFFIGRQSFYGSARGLGRPHRWRGFRGERRQQLWRRGIQRWRWRRW